MPTFFGFTQDQKEGSEPGLRPSSVEGSKDRSIFFILNKVEGLIFLHTLYMLF